MPEGVGKLGCNQLTVKRPDKFVGIQAPQSLNATNFPKQREGSGYRYLPLYLLRYIRKRCNSRQIR